MSLETRIERLENFIGVGNEIQPLIVINSTDCRKGSKDKGTPLLAIVPGKIRGPHGVTLTRAENEAPDDFLKRCESKHTEIYV